MKVLAIDFKWFPHTVFPCDGYTKALIKYLIKNIFQCGRFGGIDCWWIWGNKTRNIWRRTWRRPKQDKKVENCRRKFRRRRPCQRGWQNRSKVTPFNVIFDIISLTTSSSLNKLIECRKHTLTSLPTTQRFRAPRFEIPFQSFCRNCSARKVQLSFSQSTREHFDQ